MGISTIQSYRGAQIFEAIGLKQSVVDKYFTWTASRVEGIGLDVIAEEVLTPPSSTPFRIAGQWPRRSMPAANINGARTANITCSIRRPFTSCKCACRTGQLQDVQRIFRRWSTTRSKKLCTLRGLLDFKNGQTGSHRGSRVGRRDHEALQNRRDVLRLDQQGSARNLAIAMNRIGGKSNTGEGGEDPARYISMPNGDSKNSAIKQVASGRFGVTSQYLVNAKELADQNGARRQARRRRPIARQKKFIPGLPRSVIRRPASA